MKQINIPSTEKSPKVIFDPKKHLFEMEGNSRPENVRDFFYPIIDTLKEHFDNIIKNQPIKKNLFPIISILNLNILILHLLSLFPIYSLLLSLL